MKTLMKKIARKILFDEIDNFNKEILKLNKHMAEMEPVYKIGISAKKAHNAGGVMRGKHAFEKIGTCTPWYCMIFGDTRSKGEKIEDMKVSAKNTGIRHKGHGKIYNPEGRELRQK
jgi:hypothetical protein